MEYKITCDMQWNMPAVDSIRHEEERRRERRSTMLENMEYREKKHKVREHGVQREEAQG